MRTLLLADDVMTTLAVMKSFLEARSFKVFATTSSLQVPKLAAGVRPDLVILDYEMPGMNGDELCRRLKSERETARIPVMILTAHEDEATRHRCFEAGATAVLMKTSGRESLLEHVVSALGIPKRKHVRVPCAIAVGLKSARFELKGMIHNLSVSGLYITAADALEEGKALRIHFELPGGEDVDVLGEIVRTETLNGSLRGYGIQMIEADETSLAALRAFAKSQIE